MPLFKPMLAGRIDPPFIISPSRFPLMVSRKLDGVRATIQNGVVLSRSLKPIPNQFVQTIFGRPELNGLDGELIVGDPTEKDAFRVTTSAVMKVSGQPEVTYHVFDCFDLKWPFHMRLELAREMMKEHSVGGRGQIVEHLVVAGPAELLRLEAQWVEAGYEGLMVRSLEGLYKQGRSTLTEGSLLKLKRFMDGEAVVLGVQEQLHNGNEAITNELGRTAHSSHKENMTPMGKLGALLVKDVETGVEFSIGTGFSDAERDAIWIYRVGLVGRTCKYKYFPTGSKDKPRFPVWQGWRDTKDM